MTAVDVKLHWEVGGTIHGGVCRVSSGPRKFCGESRRKAELIMGVFSRPRGWVRKGDVPIERCCTYSPVIMHSKSKEYCLIFFQLSKIYVLIDLSLLPYCRRYIYGQRSRYMHGGRNDESPSRSRSSSPRRRQRRGRSRSRSRSPRRKWWRQGERERERERRDKKTVRIVIMCLAWSSTFIYWFILI